MSGYLRESKLTMRKALFLGSQFLFRVVIRKLVAKREKGHVAYV